MTDTALAYVAGFVDGEGCFQIGKNGSISLLIINTSLQALEFVGATLGYGTVRNRNQRVNKQQFIYTVYGVDCEEVIKSLLPYLVTKKDEAELILDYRKNVRPIRKNNQRGHFRNPERDTYRERLSALKRRESLSDDIGVTI